MILYKKENLWDFVKEVICVWFWGNLIFICIGFILAVFSILFDYIYF